MPPLVPTQHVSNNRFCYQLPVRLLGHVPNLVMVDYPECLTEPIVLANHWLARFQGIMLYPVLRRVPSVEEN